MSKNKIKIICINGKYYTKLGLYNGTIRLGNVLDIQNILIKSGNLKELGPSFYPGNFVQNWYFCIRTILSFFNKNV